MASSDQLTLAQRHVLLTVRTQLQHEFAGVFGPETIERFLNDSLDKLLPQARITTFTPCSPSDSLVTASEHSPRSKERPT